MCFTNFFHPWPQTYKCEFYSIESPTKIFKHWLGHSDSWIKRDLALLAEPFGEDGWVRFHEDPGPVVLQLK